MTSAPLFSRPPVALAFVIVAVALDQLIKYLVEIYLPFQEMVPVIPYLALYRTWTEGVAFSFRDGQAALESAGSPIGEAIVIGGGSRSDLWLSILANVLDMPLHRHAAAETGAAFGAARLARLACTGEDPREICLKPEGTPETFRPEPALVAAYAARYPVWQRAAAFSRELQ